MYYGVNMQVDWGTKLLSRKYHKLGIFINSKISSFLVKIKVNQGNI